MVNIRFYYFIWLSITSAVSSDSVALIIADVQNCFLPGGSLAVAEGEEVIPIINDIRRHYENLFHLVVLSQDWHCPDHISFASQHNGSDPYDAIDLQYDENGTLCDSTHVCLNVQYNITQVLWPDHCVMNTSSAEINTTVIRKGTDVIIRKGNNCEIDSYSAFFDNGKFRQTDLYQTLQEHSITTVFVTGLAIDYTVYHTALDSKDLGYDTYLVKDASRGVAPNTAAAAVADMKSRGIHIIQSAEVGSILKFITSAATSPGQQVGVVYLVYLMSGVLFTNGC